MRDYGFRLMTHKTLNQPIKSSLDRFESQGIVPTFLPSRFAILSFCIREASRDQIKGGKTDSGTGLADGVIFTLGWEPFFLAS